jgi:hypothetical protein
MMLFPAPTSLLRKMEDIRIPCFDATRDPEGVGSYVSHMDHFYDNNVVYRVETVEKLDEILRKHRFV